MTEEVDILRTSQDWSKLLVGNQYEDGWLKRKLKCNW
jgi:hypothetical protein